MSETLRKIKIRIIRNFIEKKKFYLDVFQIIVKMLPFQFLLYLLGFLYHFLFHELSNNKKDN